MMPIQPDVVVPNPNPGAILTCPACGAEIFGLRHLRNAVICIGCRALVTADYNDKREVVLRYPTDEEETLWLQHPQVQRAIATVAVHHERHGSPHPGISRPDDGKPPY